MLLFLLRWQRTRQSQRITVLQQSHQRTYQQWLNLIKYEFLNLDSVERYHWDWISFQKWKVPRTIEWRREGTSQLRRVMMHNTILHNQRNQNYPVQPGIFSIQLLNIPSQIMTSFFFFFFNLVILLRSYCGVQVLYACQTVLCVCMIMMFVKALLLFWIDFQLWVLLLTLFLHDIPGIQDFW